MSISTIYLNGDLLDWADYTLSKLIRHNWEGITPVIPEITNKVDWIWGACTNEAIAESSQHNIERLLEDDMWDALLKEAPGFMQELTEYCDDTWDYLSCPNAGRWLDRLGGEWSIGMVYRTLKCPQCSLVQDRPVGRFKGGYLNCNRSGCEFHGDSGVWLAANEMPLENNKS